MIDRRAFIAGLTTIGATAVLPGLQPRALFAAPPRREVPVTAKEIILDGRWVYEDDEESRRFCIRHVRSGFGFVKRNRSEHWRSFTCKAPGQTRDRASLRNCFARAAGFVAYEASVLRRARCHPGAICLKYYQNDPTRFFDKIDTEDAPPTGWVGHLFEWRDFERVFRA